MSGNEQSNQHHDHPDEWIPQHVLITGGAGFIGTNLAYYVAEHFPTTAITVLDALTYAGNRSNLDAMPADRFRFIHGDICDAPRVDAICSPESVHNSSSVAQDGHSLPPIDAIIHCAAESHNDNSIMNAAPFLRTNVDGTYVLLEAARKYDLRFHHMSTDEVYGDLPVDSPEKFTESSPYHPSSPYSASKAASDHLVRAWHRTYGVRTTISNCGNNYGPWQHVEKFIPRQITNILSGRRAKLYGDGEEVRDWIHVEDHCAAVMQILTRGTLGETYLVGADGCRSNIEVLHDILTSMGLPENDFDHVRNRPGVDRKYALDASKIERELGWRPQHTDFAAELKNVVRWYADHRDWWEPDKDATETSYAAQGH
ncbi:dTDP-glucose 4,6-dehydratase [Bifidobacterium magnum]|nr:dTDP-glucose 4,6-dehydratase [Bifidobacterium magnum]